MNKERSKTGMNLSYLLIGGGVGAVLALLFAPKAGQEFRADIADATRKGLDKTEEMAAQLSEKATRVYEDTKTKAGEIYDSAKQKLHSAEIAIGENHGDLQNGINHKVERDSHIIKMERKEYDREDRLQGNANYSIGQNLLEKEFFDKN